MRKHITVLSLDGGGIRGLIGARLLVELERRSGKRISELFDLIAGTSTGGILALGMVKPDDNGKPFYTAEEMMKFYTVDGPKIFPTDIFNRMMGDVRQVFDEKYPAHTIEHLLKQRFGNSTMAQAVSHLIVPAYNTYTAQGRFFKSRRLFEDGSVPMWEVARATSAAPTYFEAFNMLKPDGSREPLIDGGVIANNPTMTAYAEILEHTAAYVGEARVEQPLVVVSIGTGQLVSHLTYDEIKDWGIWEWVRPLVDILVNGAVHTVHYEMQEIMLSRQGAGYYFRLQPLLSESMLAIDDASGANLDALIALTEKYIADNDALINQILERITA